jgi:hypothetical protein
MPTVMAFVMPTRSLVALILRPATTTAQLPKKMVHVISALAVDQAVVELLLLATP